jgi:hypothetical protein
VAAMARWSVRADVKDCFSGPAARRVGRETCARRGGADGVARGCCNSLMVPAVEAGVLDASTVGVSAAAAASSAVGVTPAVAAVDALEGKAADALDVAGVEGLTAAVGASDAVVVVRLEAAAVDSGAAVDWCATTVAFG